MNSRRITALLLGLIVAPVSAGTIHVPGDQPTIQDAILRARLLDTIIVAPGTYFESISFGGKVITVQSSNPTDPSVVAATIINSNGAGPVVTFSGGEAPATTLDGFTITGGTIGIDAHRSPAAIRRCIVRDNSSYGIFEADGPIDDCTIRYNDGWGINDCDGIIQRCLIQSNFGAGMAGCDGDVIDSRIERTNDGPGIKGGSVDILRCTISSNGTQGISHPHTGNIDQSFIIGNLSFGIYGLDRSDGGLVRNSVIAGNRNDGFNSSQKNVLSCTVTGNTGYGFYSHNGSISHCIVWNNLAGQLVGSTSPVFSSTANPYVLSPGLWDPVENEWIDWDYHLSSLSVDIDTGDPAYASGPDAATVDIDGNPRIVGGRVDIGAYEFRAECVGPDFDGDGTPDVCDSDIDGDGIPNTVDQCAKTPPGVSVDEDGRPRADLNSDCTVDLGDYAIFQRDIFGP